MCFFGKERREKVIFKSLKNPLVNKDFYVGTFKSLNFATFRVLLNPPTTDHLLTDSPTHRPTDQILTDPTDKILFKRLHNRKISILQNTNTAGKMLNCTSIYYLLKEFISLYKFERRQKNSSFL